MAKRYLQGKGVAYEEIDIERVPGAAEQVKLLAGGCETVPTIIIGDSLIIDWDLQAVAVALTKAGLA